MIELFKNVISDIKKTDFPKEIIHLLNENKRLEISASIGSLKSIFTAQIFQTLDKAILWVFDSQDKTQDAKIDLEHLLPVKSSALFPAPRKSKWGHDDAYVVSQQAEALEALSRKERQILLISQPALETRVKSPKEISTKAIKLSVSQKYAFNDFIKNLQRIGFEREPVVEKPGDMAIRGGIVDVYPFTAVEPVRIEFWGDTIESIREFDSLSQRSTEKLEKISIFPKPEASTASQYATVIDFLPPDSIVIFDDAPAIEEAVTGATPPRDFDHLAEDQSGDDELWQVFLSDFAHLKTVYFTPFKANYADTKIEIPARHPKSLNGDIKLLVSEFSLNGKLDCKNYFLCESPGHAERMRDLFDDYDLTESDVTIIGLNLSRGFCLPDNGIHIYTDHEFYGRRRRHRGRRKLKEGLTLRQLKTLNMGDFVVHADHGIGRFIKLEKITVAGHERECLLLEYKDSDKLYVPLDRMDRVQKYTGKDGTVPKIHKLGSQVWDRLKKRTKSKLKDIAEELVKLYSLRKSQKGFAFSPDTTWQKELE
ncbi:MAG: CarD family transcriptional regulator, partial [bacterium]